MSSWTKIAIWAAVVVVVFAYLWWQGQIKRFAAYCQETWVELQKCAWPTWEELKGSTVVIAITICLLGVFVYAVDRIFFGVFFQL